MEEIEGSNLRLADINTLKILNRIEQNPNISRTDLRKVTGGVKTIEQTLLFLKKIGAIEITEEDYRGKNAWFSTITDLGKQILINAGFQVEKVRGEIKFVNYEDDHELIETILWNAVSLGYYETKEFGSFDDVVSLWDNEKIDETAKLIILKKIHDYFKELMDRYEDYRTKEIKTLHERLVYTIEHLEKEQINRRATG